MLSARVGKIEPSSIRRMFDLMATMEDPINLSIGQAHFEAPEPLVDAACRALRAGWNRYTVTQGLPELNERVIEMVARTRGHRPAASLITAGASGGIFTAFFALLDPGDEVLLPDPHFVMYRHVAALCGANVKYYDMYPDFRLDPDRLAAEVTPKTKIIFVNSPSNPTGTVLTRGEMAAVVQVAERAGAWLVSDEIYDDFVYDQPYVSPVGMTERVVQIAGFSKSYGIAGWRMGYATGSAEVIDAMKRVQQFTFVCAPAPLQRAVLDAAFGLDISTRIAEYRAKRDLIVAELDPAYELVVPGGAFYAFPKLPGRISEAVFLEAAVARKLLIVPGSAFSARATHFRLSFAASDRDLRRGIAVLNALAAEFRAAG